MRKALGKYIESDSEKGAGELRFIGTRIAVALEYVGKIVSVDFGKLQ
jgi:uncharacterized protein (DUF433 family)